jgi:hypothetical protein
MRRSGSNVAVPITLFLSLLLSGCSTTSLPEAEAEQLASITRSSYAASAASFVSFDDCLYTDVQVFVWENAWSGGPGRPERSAAASLNLYQVDTCSEWGWDVIMSASGVTEVRGGEFTLTGHLGSARLRTTIEVRDWESGATQSVDVDLSWSGIGDTWSWRDRWHDHGGDSKYMFRTAGLGRSAVVTGALDLGGMDVAVPMPGDGWMASGQNAFTAIDTSGRRPTPPEISYFDGYPYEIFPGGAAILYWSVTGSDPIELSLDQGIGDVSGMNGVHVAPETTTTYTLTATNRRGSASAQFTVVVLPPPDPDGLEENDTPGTATEIELDYVRDALTLTPGDVDWFVFTVDEPAGVHVNLWGSGHGASPLGALFDATLAPLGGLGSDFETFLEAGVHYLAVSGYPDFDFVGDHTHSGSYTLSVIVAPLPSPDAREPNDDPTTAAPIELDFVDESLTLTPGDVDWFTFTLPDPATVMVHVWGSALGLVSGVFDASMVPMPRGDGFELDPGTYFIAVSGHPDDTFQGDHWVYGPYTLVVSSFVPPPPDPLEPNDSPEQATAVDLDFSSGELTITPGDVDWFTFTLAASGTVTADIDASILGSDLDSLMVLLDVDRVPIIMNDDHDGLDPRIEAHLAAGTYYLTVTGYADFDLVGHHGQNGFYFVAVTLGP